ncbi:AAA family ATPase [Natroniella acetigena]|uniref:AAA family ATPase n=1 Tax=Natroniella acetigena TaxID=52004 RepID=UPI00200A661A|nr:AAA family ATPase [Natroniella acetigena]MCK8826536.1 AAA family ATPase [Natroniella acetigena]
MQKIRAIEIKNFQSHADSRLEFEEGLNVITGPSDQGKSAIIRALRWVLYNEPRGTDFIRTGTNACQVTIELNNDFKITRKRTKKENRYEVITPTGENHVFEKIGSKVPQEVKDIHGMPKIELDSDLETTLNLDYQLDGAFLLNASGSTRAKVLGRLIKVHIVDAAIRDTGKDLRELKQEQKRVEQELVELDNKLEEFSDLPSLAAEIKQQEQLLVRIKEVNNKLKKFKTIHQRINSINQELNKWEKINQKLGNLAKIDNMYDKIVAKIEQLRVLKQLVKRQDKVEYKLGYGVNYLKKFKGINHIEQIHEQLQQKQDRYYQFKRFLTKYDRINDQIEQNKNLIEQMGGIEKSSQILDKKLVVNSKKIESLLQLKGNLAKIEGLIEQEQKLLDLLPAAELLSGVGNGLVQNYKKLEQLNDLATRKENITSRINETKEELQQRKQENQELVIKYSKKLKAMGKCPTCFNPVDQQVIKGIVSNYKYKGDQDGRV